MRDDQETWLTVIGPGTPPSWINQATDRGAWVRVRCRCGVVKDVRKRDVDRNRIRSCGCMAKPQRESLKHSWSRRVRDDIATATARVEAKLEVVASPAMTRRERARSIGAAVREARVQRGLSQQALCESCGLMQRRLSRVELGQREMRVGELITLCAALALSADEVLGLARSGAERQAT
jgi:ribosome-binding protein aMBF1 (putative translation factor)